MSNSRRPNRPYARRGRISGDDPSSHLATGGEAARLSALAGSTRTSFETLEPRKLLFGLEITADDVDASGIGTVSTQFGYRLPFIFSEIPDPEEPDLVEEDFDDEMLGMAITSGTTFDESQILLTYITEAATSVTILPDGDDDQDLRLRFGSITVDESFSFQFQQGVDEGAATPRVATNATLDFEVAGEGSMSGVGGLDVDPVQGNRIELLRGFVVVETIEGNDLAVNYDPTTGEMFINFAPGFDTVRISRVPEVPIGGQDLFLDSIDVTFPAGRFGDFHDNAIFGAQVLLTGEVGTRIEFFDLYGRPMVETTALGTTENSDVALIDVNDDGIPEFNDGIGRIEITSATASTVFNMVGFRIMDGDFEFTTPEGFTEAFIEAGFGYDIDFDPMPPVPFGLPPIMGSVIVGSPFVRDNSDPALYLGSPPAFVPLQPSAFEIPDQGIFTDGPVQGILVHGSVHGQLQVDGSAERLSVAYLPGSVTVEGDLGSLFVQGDAGYYIPDDAGTDQVGSTSSLIQVGRTLGQIHIGGYSRADVNVLGDIDNPARAPLDFVNYVEREGIWGINPATMDGEMVVMQLLATPGAPAAPGARPIPFGTGFYRNDSILSAEYIGYTGSIVQLSGQLGQQDPINTSEDPTDVYSFAVERGREVVVEFSLPGGSFLVSVVNRDGEVIASHQNQSNPSVNQFTPDGGLQLKFVADSTDVYYLVMSEYGDGQFGSAVDYTATITGIAPTVFGKYRSASGLGGPGDDLFITLQSGSMGILAAGTGFVAGDGEENDTSEVTAGGGIGTGNADLLLNLRSLTLTTALDLHAIVTGSDVQNPTFVIGGNLGTLVTGRSALVGQSVNEGDLESITLQVGGQIGEIDVFGTVGFQQDAEGETRGTRGPVVIRTGTEGEPGHIGSFTVGAWVQGDTLSVTTSPNSVVGSFIVGTRGSADANANSLDDLTPLFTLGPGSDLRFTDFGRIETAIDPDAVDTILSGQRVQYTDDGGANFTIQVTGAGSFATIRFLPIDGSEGVAIARIDATLNAGGDLIITGQTPGVVSIGRINVVTDGTTQPTGEPASQVRFLGTAEIDVWRLIGFGALDVVQNLTNGGDIVAMDLVGVEDVTIGTGDLGRTQRTGIGPGFAPVLGIAQGGAGAGGVNGPIGLNAGAVNGAWDGSLLIPLNARGDTNSLQDFGSPFDTRLNGLLVRGGDVQSVRVGGAVGDVILTNGDLFLLRADDDGLSAFGDFDGIIGTIYATNLVNIDVGQGLMGPGPSPFARAGIFAVNDINLLTGRAVLNPQITGVIVASNGAAAVDNTTGVGRIRFTDASIDDAYIAASTLDSWWWSTRRGAVDGGNDDPTSGDIVDLDLTRTNLFRSTLFAFNVLNVEITDGAYDATSTIARGDVLALSAQEFRNSTRLGEPTEFRPNRVDATGDLVLLETIGSLGDIADLVIDVQGDITNEVRAFNIERSSFNVDSTISSIFATNDLRAILIDAGELIRLAATNDIRSSSVIISGPVLEISAGGNISNIKVITTGPDGRIENVNARLFLTGEISSSGGIGLIESLELDIVASVETTMAGASLDTIRAGRDIAVDMDIAGDLTLMEAGRHVGRQTDEPRDRAIIVAGNVDQILAPGGQVYTDFQIGQGITGRVQIGRVAALPGNDLVGNGTIQTFGRINAFEIEGDFDGRIISFSGGIGSVIITRGSFRPGAAIEAYDGSIDLVQINGGHLMGDIYAEDRLRGVEVLAFEGFVGDLGVNFRRSMDVPFDEFRNQLPPDAALLPTFQGPRIEAGTNLGRVIVNGGAFEAEIVAGHYIGRVEIAGNMQNDNITEGIGGSFITAGDRIDRVIIGGFAGGVVIHAGILEFGADDRPGGVGDDADLIKFGIVGDITIGAAGAVSVSAGMLAGEDGRYGLNPMTNTSDDLVANGKSRIGTVVVNGAAQMTTAFADNGIGFTSPSVIRGGPGLRQEDPDMVLQAPPAGSIAKGTPVPFTTAAGEAFTVTFTGPGRVDFDATIGQLAVVNTTLDSNITINVAGGRLTDFEILSNDGASINTVIVRANLFGNSSFYFDGFVQRAVFGSIDAPAGFFGAGRDVGQFVFGNMVSGEVFANFITNMSFGGSLGKDAEINLLGVGSVTFGRDILGKINARRDIGSLVARDVTGATIRAGRTIGSFTAASLDKSFVSTFNGLNVVNISGNVVDSLLSAGGDLGSDGTFGGTGDAADRVSNGFIGSVAIGGDFRGSDIATGMLRGDDGFLGTEDDVVDEGRSFLGPVTIGGEAFGSTFNSESYRIISNGAIEPVLVRGSELTRVGNLEVVQVQATAGVIEVSDLRVVESNRIFTALIEFNRPIEFGTFGPALTVSEVRDDGATLLDLAQGTDYTIAYDRVTNTARVTFQTDITNRDLADAATPLPAPGVYRFFLDASILRGQTQNSLLDGNGDAIASTSDDFSEEQVVGDAGDKFTPNLADGRFNFYGPANLDLVLDSFSSFNGLPDPNQEYTVRGTLGDHPDANLIDFRSGGDTDIYQITLTNGQILRLGQLDGAAGNAVQEVYNSDGDLIVTSSFGRFGGIADAFLFGAFADPISFDPGTISVLPTTAPDADTDTNGIANLLVKETDTYFIVVSSEGSVDGLFNGTVDPNDPDAVANIAPMSGTTGSYSFSLKLFEDGDTGFTGNSGAGDGVTVLSAPLPSDSGFDNGGNVVSNGYVFTLDLGADGARNTADDVVRGVNGGGITAERTSGSDGVFGTPNDVVSSFIAASIGEAGLNGIAGELGPDVDVYHLNGRDTIAPGTRVTATLRLTEFGSNIGLAPVPNLEELFFGTSFAQDLRGSVQFALFDTTNSVSIDDAKLVAAPEVAPVGGQTPESVTDGQTTYGYNEDGDFFISFLTPARQDVGGDAPATFALYVQGAIRSDYRVEIVQSGTGSFTKAPQNILIETRGGEIDWLETGEGLSTSLAPFTVSVVGFAARLGRIGGQNIDDFVVEELIDNLDDIFFDAGVDVRLSDNSADFEGEAFSTVFITGSNAPASFFNTNTFGSSERFDAFNADHSDEAVVFMPSLAVLGNPPTANGIESLVQGLSASVSRRIGELVGLRTAATTFGSPNLDTLGSNSVLAANSTSVFRFLDEDRALSVSTDVLDDTNFYLGDENAVDLLDRVLADRF